MAVNNRLFKENFEASLVQNFQVTTKSAARLPQNYIENTDFLGGELNM
jgi:hypothetical protein